MNAARYRKKPVVIEAMHYTGEKDKHAAREFVTTPIAERADGLEAERIA